MKVVSYPERFRNAILKVVRIPRKLQNAVLEVVRNARKLPNAVLKVVRNTEKLLNGVLWFFAVKQGVYWIFEGVFGESQIHFLCHTISTNIACIFSRGYFNEKEYYFLYSKYFWSPIGFYTFTKIVLWKNSTFYWLFWWGLGVWVGRILMIL